MATELQLGSSEFVYPGGSTVVEALGQRQGNPQAEEISLDQISAPGRVKVLRVKGDRSARRMLAQLDIRVGEILDVQRQAPLGGPLLVKSGGTAVAISRSLARMVIGQVLP